MLVTRGGADGHATSLLHKLSEVVQKICVAGAASPNAVASTSGTENNPLTHTFFGSASWVFNNKSINLLSRPLGQLTVKHSLTCFRYLCEGVVFLVAAEE